MGRVQRVQRVRRVQWVRRVQRVQQVRSRVHAHGSHPCTHRDARTHRTCTAPIAPIAPVAPIAPPVAPEDPLDRVIDLGEPRDLEVDPPAFTTNEERQSPPRPLNRPWSTQPSQELDAADAAEPETGRRKWPIAVAVLAVAIIAALSVGWFLRWRAAGSVTETPAGVDATIVDLPASAPAAPGASGGQARTHRHPLHPEHVPQLRRHRVPRRARLSARRPAAC